VTKFQVGGRSGDRCEPRINSASARKLFIAMLTFSTIKLQCLLTVRCTPVISCRLMIQSKRIINYYRTRFWYGELSTKCAHRYGRMLL